LNLNIIKVADLQNAKGVAVALVSAVPKDDAHFILP
jgi:hypothetical protein